jgi:hypothetical protein
VVLDGEKDESLVIFHEERFINVRGSKNSFIFHKGIEKIWGKVFKYYYNAVLD